MLQLSYDGEFQWDNTKGIFLKGVLSGNYGVNLVGDIINFAPSQTATDGGILDPLLAYNMIIQAPPRHVGIFGEDLGGYYCQITKAAVPTLKNWGGLRVFQPGGTELASAVAYAAAVLAGNVNLQVFLTLQ